MDEGKEFRGILVQVRINPYCVKKNIVDLDRGETVLSKLEADVFASFANGYSACPVEVVITREIADNGAEYLRVSDYSREDLVYLQGWRSGEKKKPGKRGGKETLHIVNFHQMGRMPVELQQMVLQLAPYMKRDGLLTSKNYKRALSWKDIAAIWQLNRSRTFEILEELSHHGAIMQNEVGYYINRGFVRRG